jgi:hypothetical protein
MPGWKLALRRILPFFFPVISLVCSAQLPSGSVVRAESFDKPLRDTVVDLGLSRYLRPSAHSHISLYCLYYSTFMVKQLDDPGMKGTRWVTIAPIRNGHAPECQRSHDSTERFLAKEWWSFIGVKDQLLFLEAADGEDGGLPMRFLDLKTGRKIFEDSISLTDSRIEFAYTPDGKMSIRYLRVVHGDCSIPKSGEICWNKFRQQFGLALASAPMCTGYEGEQPIPVEEEQNGISHCLPSSSIAR